MSGDETRRGELIQHAAKNDDEDELWRHVIALTERLGGRWGSAGIEYQLRSDEFQLAQAWESLRYIQAKRIAEASAAAAARASNASRWAALAAIFGAAVAAVNAIFGGLLSTLPSVGMWG